MQYIEEKTQGRLALGAGTLYGALYALRKAYPLTEISL